ncbi:signal-transducing adaptor protein 1-like [Thunnus albacares]|uniref:signal-transducing adaptor protein 1-like n=1 Tax=Thunnus maccoyii TaxID=8240 RepID=UPI001C4C5094|nr:signal-transducing adaptor protein 1-like [Thunnus maccoyii]XP_044217008.1 signal-transducing adaptor protein 1-like [Thunnus albacares]
MAKRTGRQRSQLPHCYYEGFLEKRSFKDKKSRKLWTCLCGNTLFFFNEKRDTSYIEKLDLSDLISITDDGSVDRNLDAARMNVQMKDENIKFTAPNAEARELWKGFIHSVTELSVPFSLNLLPGQIHMLKETVEKEKERKKKIPPPAVTSSNPYITVQADMPACFHSVSRLEAELLLEREAKRGNLLLRPGSSGSSFAVTTRQDLNGSIFKHYRVTRKHEGGFTIDVDDPVPCATLHDVINYLVETTDRVLIPLILEEAYEKNISFIRSDNENGEKSVQDAPSYLIPPSLPPKLALRSPTPEPALEAVVEESLYLNDMLEETEQEKEDSSVVLLPQTDKRAPKKAIMPPIPVPRKLTSSTSIPSSASLPNTKMRAHLDPLGQTISELKMKLEKQARCLE